MKYVRFKSAITSGVIYNLENFDGIGFENRPDEFEENGKFVVVLSRASENGKGNDCYIPFKEEKERDEALKNIHRVVNCMEF